MFSEKEIGPWTSSLWQLIRCGISEDVKDISMPIKYQNTHSTWETAWFFFTDAYFRYFSTLSPAAPCRMQCVEGVHSTSVSRCRTLDELVQLQVRERFSAGAPGVPKSSPSCGTELSWTYSQVPGMLLQIWQPIPSEAWKKRRGSLRLFLSNIFA